MKVDARFNSYRLAKLLVVKSVTLEGHMKKILLGTSALCAVAAAGPALAQSASEPVKLGFGGYWNSAYGYIASQNGGAKFQHRSDDINTDAVIQVKGSTKFDNGLTAGVMVQFR